MSPNPDGGGGGRHNYINILNQELSTAKIYEHNLFLLISISAVRLQSLVIWFMGIIASVLHLTVFCYKRPHKLRFIAKYSSCSTTRVTSCFNAFETML